MRFVVGINDDYIDPEFSSDNIREAVAFASALESDPTIWKADIEARADEDDDTLLVMVVFEKPAEDDPEYGDWLLAEVDKD